MYYLYLYISVVLVACEWLNSAEHNNLKTAVKMTSKYLSKCIEHGVVIH